MNYDPCGYPMYTERRWFTHLSECTLSAVMLAVRCGLFPIWKHRSLMLLPGDYDRYDAGLWMRRGFSSVGSRNHEPQSLRKLGSPIPRSLFVGPRVCSPLFELIWRNVIRR